MCLIVSWESPWSTPKVGNRGGGFWPGFWSWVRKTLFKISFEQNIMETTYISWVRTWKALNLDVTWCFPLRKSLKTSLGKALDPEQHGPGELSARSLIDKKVSLSLSWLVGNFVICIISLQPCSSSSSGRALWSGCLVLGSHWHPLHPQPGHVFNLKLPQKHWNEIAKEFSPFSSK